MTIITSGSDGAIYEFSARSGQREREYIQKGCKYNQAVGSEDGNIFAVGSDRILKELGDSAVQKELDSGTMLTQIALSHPLERMLFTGSELGVIRSFRFPLTGHCQDYQCHRAAVTRLRLSRDDAFLFSAGMDGCLTMFEIREPEGRSSLVEAAMPWSEEVLVTRSDLEERSTMTSELKNKVDELTLHNEYQLRLQEMMHADRLKEVKESCQIALEEQKRLLDQVKDAKQDVEIEYEEAVRKLEEAEAANMVLARQDHQEQIMKEVEMYHELELEMRREEMDSGRATHLAEERHQDELDRRQVALDEILNKERDKVNHLIEERQAIRREFTETKRQLEQDTDVEIQELKERFDQTLASERETTLRLKGENGIMKKRFSSLSNDIEDQKEELKMMSEKESAVRGQINILRKEIDGNKSHIGALDGTIGDKERSIYELKKKNQEMEKHKFVLDYQIKELKRQIEPRECKIADMEEQEENMDTDLEALHHENGTLNETVDDLKRQIGAVQKQINEARHQSQAATAKSSRQMFQLDRVVHLDDEKLAEAVGGLISARSKDGSVVDDDDPEIVEEYASQIGFLKGTITRLKGSVQLDTRRHRRETHRIMQQNGELIKEINTLRKELALKRLSVNQGAIIDKAGEASSGPPDVDTIVANNNIKIGQLKKQLASISSG